MGEETKNIVVTNPSALPPPPPEDDVNACAWYIMNNHGRTTLSDCSRIIVPDELKNSYSVSLVLCPKKHGSAAGLMLAKRLRRWPNIEPTADLCFLFICVWLPGAGV